MAHIDDDFDDRPRPPRDDDDYPVPPRPQKSHLGLILGILGGSLLLCCGGGIAGFLYFTMRATTAIQEVVQQAEDANINAQHDAQTTTNFAQINNAFARFRTATGVFPCNTYGPGGKPLLSWRVHLLPHLGQGDLYKQFRLNESWDSPNNLPLLARMPSVYQSTNGARWAMGNGRTYYRAMTGPGFAMEPAVGKMQPQASQPLGQPARDAGFPDGLSISIVMFEASDAVEWTKPDELDWPQNNPKPSAVPVLGAAPVPQAKYFWAMMANGANKKIKRNMPDETLWRLFNRRDGMPIADDWEHR